MEWLKHLKICSLVLFLKRSVDLPVECILRLVSEVVTLIYESECNYCLWNVRQRLVSMLALFNKYLTECNCCQMSMSFYDKNWFELWDIKESKMVWYTHLSLWVNEYTLPQIVTASKKPLKPWLHKIPVDKGKYLCSLCIQCVIGEVL